MQLTLILIFLLSISSAFAQEGQVKDSDTYQHKKNSIYIDDYVIFLPAVCYDRIFPLKKTIGLVVKAGVGLNLYGGGSFFVTESFFSIWPK